MKTQIDVSLIITTYNWPQVLQKVLEAVAQQTDVNFEVIIADDGSGPQTLACIEQAKICYAMDIRHVWQPNAGFQAAKIRNKAAAAARGSYLIFLDGDCIPFPHFITRHRRLAEPGWFVVGNRILLNPYFTQKVISGSVQLSNIPFLKWLFLRMTTCCNRVLPLLSIPLFPRKLRALRWQGAKTCNLGIWKEDFLRINGFDESFVGWGYEDSDLICRLLKAGCKHKEGKFALPVIHCWHKEQDRTFEKENLSRLYNRLADETIESALGVSQYF